MIYKFQFVLLRYQPCQNINSYTVAKSKHLSQEGSSCKIIVQRDSHVRGQIIDRFKYKLTFHISAFKKKTS